MRSRRSTTLVLGLAALVGTALVSSAGSPASAVGSPPAPAGQNAQQHTAEQALAAVEAAFHAGPLSERSAGPAAQPRDLTLQMVQLSRHLDDLSPSDRATAQRYLARPTTGDAPYGNFTKPAAAKSDCSSVHFCIWWDPGTNDAPSTYDGNNNGIPDQVDLTREVMDHVYQREVVDGGYHSPPQDSLPKATAKPTVSAANRPKFDVYLADIGKYGLYGFCTTDSGQGQAQSEHGYCVLDNDFSLAQFPAHTPKQNLEVTAAHEFFHAIQFGYDSGEDLYLMENTAVWMEDEVYNGVNDNRQYLPSGDLRHPGRPLDDLDAKYGNWIWWRYLTEHFRAAEGGIPVLVRHVWEHAAKPGVYSMKALEQVLSGLHTSLTTQVAHFGVANRRPGHFYSEGSHYHAAPLAKSWTLHTGHTGIGWQDTTPWHLSNQTYAFKPGRGFKRSKAHLHLQLDLPSKSKDPYAQVTVVPRSGAWHTREIKLDKKGDGGTKTSFDSKKIKRIELTVTNAGHHYSRCGQGYEYSCQGVPDDAFRHYAFKATGVR